MLRILYAVRRVLQVVLSPLLRPLKIAGRIIGLLLLIIIGFPLVNYDLSKYAVVTVWDAGNRYMYPPLVLPGPIRVKPGAHPVTAVIFTADDGARSWYELLFPILQKYRVPCTQFVISDRIGEYGLMNERNIREVKQWGCDIGSHTRRHFDLKKLPLEEAQKEIALSRRDLQERFGPDVADVLASPEGNYTPNHLEMMKKAGYIAHVRGFGEEADPEDVNDVSEEGLAPFELVRFDWKNYHSADDVCNEVKRAVGKPQLIIFVSHFGMRRSGPPPKLPFKTVADIRGNVPPLLHVYDEVFEAGVACIAKMRDEGSVFFPASIREALEFYKAFEEKGKAHG